MPMAIPLLAAYAGVAGGIAAAGGMAAIAAGGLTLASGMMIAGGVMTGLGALTKNEKLSRLGAIVGLAGGVGNLASKMTENAAGTVAAEGATSTAGNTVADAVQAASPAAEAAQGAGVASDATSLADAATLSDESLSLMESGPGPSMTDSLRARAPGVIEAAGPLQLSGPGAPDLGDPGVAEAAGPLQLSGPTTPDFNAVDPGFNVDEIASRGLVDSQFKQTPWWKGLTDTFNDTAGWMKKNPEATKLGAGLVQGAAKYMGDSQLLDEEFKKRKAYQDWVRQRYSDSVRNLQIPSPIGVAAPSTGIIAGQRG